MDTPDRHARLLAILEADVSGYSRLMSLDDGATVVALDAGRAVFREHIAAHGGRVIDMSGDSVLSVFGTATGAVAAALALQQQLSVSAADVPEERRMRFRIGIHVGDVIEKDDGTVYGDGVNIASRLEGLAVPGDVAVSQAVHDMVFSRRRRRSRMENGPLNRMTDDAEVLKSGVALAGRHFCGAQLCVLLALA